MSRKYHPPVYQNRGDKHEPLLSRKDIAESWKLSAQTITRYFDEKLCNPPSEAMKIAGFTNKLVYRKSQVVAWKTRIDEHKQNSKYFWSRPQ